MKPKPPRAAKTGKALEEFLTTMRERFTLVENAEADIRKDGLEDWLFRAGEQWDAEMRRLREGDDRPCYTVNRVQDIVRHVTNEQRQQRPAIEVSPIGDGADVETAEVLQGVTRHTEMVSDADIAYDTAFEGMATGGFGYFRLTPQYVHAKSFDQEPRFERVLNPFSVYCAPCKEPDYKDMRYCIITEDVVHDQYKEDYPHSELTGLSEFSTVGDRAPGWVNGDSVRVAEYFTLEQEKRTIVKGRDGKVYFDDELPKGVKAAKNPQTGKPYTRETEVPCVYWCKTNGLELLEAEKEVACDFIPVIPVLGEEFIVEGRRHLVGVIRYARTPQQMYNLWTSAMAETIALAPKAPFFATPAQMEGFEHIYKTANTTNWPVIPYNPDPQADGKPGRNFGEPPIEAITSAIAHADNDLKTVASYDPAMALKGDPNESGEALRLRHANSDQANFGFGDNMGRSVRHGGRCVVSMWQRLADVPRTVRVLNPDGTKDLVELGAQTLYKGAQKIFDLTVGIFDVGVSAGPSFKSRRDEAVKSMLSLVQSFPPLMQFCGDLLVRDMDWPQSQAIADRLKKMLPAQLQDPADGAQAVPPQAQAQMAQQGLMIQKLTAAVHAMSAKLETQQVLSASKERIALINAKAGIYEAALKAKSAEALAAFQADLDHIDRQLSLIPDPALGQEADGSAAQPGQQQQEPQGPAPGAAPQVAAAPAVAIHVNPQPPQPPAS
jgi:portal protein